MTSGARTARRRSSVAEPRSLALPAWVWYSVFFLVPIGFLVAHAVATRSGFDVRFGFSGEQFEKLFEGGFDSIYVGVFGDTLWLAARGTLICLLVGYPFAYFLATRVSRRRSLALLLVIVPFWTSLLIRTYSWGLILGGRGPLSGLLQDLHLLDGPLDILYTENAVLIGLVYGYLPLMIFPLYVSIERLDRRLLEASRDLGVGRLATLRRVTVPLTLPGILTGVLLVFVPMTGEYVVPTILGGASTFLVGSLVANETLSAVNYPFGAAIALALIAVLLVIVIVLLRVIGRRSEEALGAAL